MKELGKNLLLMKRNILFLKNLYFELECISTVHLEGRSQKLKTLKATFEADRIPLGLHIKLFSVRSTNTLFKILRYDIKTSPNRVINGLLSRN